MEAREYEYFENETQPAAPSIEEQPLTQQYLSVMQENKRKAAQVRKSRRRELSFFLHVASYSVLFSLLYPIFQAIAPFILSFPLALFLPIGLILVAKFIFKKFLLKK